MKRHIIALLAVMLFHASVVAEIKNGYEPKINDTRLALDSLSTIKTGFIRDNETKTPLAPHKIQHKIDSLRQIILSYEITEELLDQFRLIAPVLYNEIDTITNAYGTNTDVFVKFIPDEQMIKYQKGRLVMGQCAYNERVCYSEYGINTVSVIIYSKIRPLVVLAHEFGHVKHQVPNLKSYMDYYKETYQDRSFEGYFVGHYPTDPSGKAARSNEKRFGNYCKLSKKNVKDLRRKLLALNDTIDN